jgi:hypothetical protein
MKNYVNFLLPALIVLIFLSQTTAQNVQRWVTWKVPVYPSKSAEYEAALKKQNELFRKYNWPYTCYTHQTDDYYFFHAVPVKGIDVMPEYDRKWDSL